MKTILYIGNNYCASTAELKSIIDKSPAQNSALGKELLCALKDGVLEKWLNEGGEEEQALAKELPQVQEGASDSELLRRLGECFKSDYKTQALNITDFIVLQSVNVVVGNLPSVSLPLKGSIIHCPKNDMYVKYSFTFNFKVEKNIGEKVYIYMRMTDDTRLLKCDDAQKIDLREIGNTLQVDFLCTYYKENNVVPQIELVAKFMGCETILWGSALLTDTFTVTVGDVSFKMIYVEGGTFRMGKSTNGNHVTPVHDVTLDSFFIAETQVTQALWQALMENNPSFYKGEQRPVESVSWVDCQEFIKKLNELTGLKFRLPTEAEWEFSAKGGNKSKGYRYSGGMLPWRVAWYKDNSGDKTHPVKELAPNELGIYDMGGNVMEWCSDVYGAYPSTPQVNPKGAEVGDARVLRGFGFDHFELFLNVVLRSHCTFTYVSNDVGLRLALDA